MFLWLHTFDYKLNFHEIVSKKFGRSFSDNKKNPLFFLLIARKHINLYFYKI